MFFKMLYDEKLAQASYIIGCQRTGEALVIDPERDIQRYIDAAKKEGLEITAVTETHIHADFLSGAREFAEQTGAMLYLSDEGDADWKYQWLDKKRGGGSYQYQLLKGGDAFKIGNIEIKALHTPGHTPEHLSFMVTDFGGGANEPMGIATGDFVFVGDVGRPDLLETAAGVAGAKEKSAKVLYNSLQTFKSFPDYLQLWPGHGSGSACGKALGAVPQSTVGYEKRFNAAIQDASEESRFVENIIYGQPEPPIYFARMKRDNKGGPAILDQHPSPALMSADALAKLNKGATILDTRSWEEFTAGHLPGAIHAPLINAFPTVAGSYVEENEGIYLIVDEDRLTEAVTDLIRIGLDNVVGFITPEMVTDFGGTLETTPVQRIETLKNGGYDPQALILDVRRADEYEAGHLAGAMNIAHTRLMARLAEIPRDRQIWVHCRTGNRAAYASGYLQSKGFDVKMLDGGYLAWSEANGEIVKKPAELA